MPVADYKPNVAAVAGFIRARTRTRGGTVAGTFNPAAATGSPTETIPTAEGVEVEIQNALGKISGKLGPDVVVGYQDDARRITALYAAMLIELTYWPEQINTGRSTYPQLKELFDEDWEELLDILGIGEKGGAGPPTVDAGFPSYGGFPTTAISMERAW